MGRGRGGNACHRTRGVHPVGPAVRSVCINHIHTRTSSLGTVPRPPPTAGPYSHRLCPPTGRLGAHACPVSPSPLHCGVCAVALCRPAVGRTGRFAISLKCLKRKRWMTATCLINVTSPGRGSGPGSPPSLHFLSPRASPILSAPLSHKRVPRVSNTVKKVHGEFVLLADLLVS